LVFWYARDFGADLKAQVARLRGMTRPDSSEYSLLDGLLQQLQRDVEAVGAAAAEERLRDAVDYNPYNWALNEEDDE
jgi:hypothetical protein